MKSLKNSFALLVVVLFISAALTSCGSAHYGCPGQDRPSFRGGYGMTFPDANKNQALPSTPKEATYDIKTMS